jgi:hypothetical protein
MSLRLSSQQAEMALRSILGKMYVPLLPAPATPLPCSTSNTLPVPSSVSYADKTEGVDYRVPDAHMFRKWRRMLHPICKWISLRAVSQAKQWHINQEAHLDSARDGTL